MKLMRKNGGFTLVELIVVIAILAILAGIAVPAYSGYIQKAEKAADLQLLGAINEAFAAACLSENTTIAAVKSAILTWDGAKVVGISRVDGAANTAIDAAFKTFYAGNEGTEFKVLANNLVFDAGKHVFIDPTSATSLTIGYGNGQFTVSGGAISALAGSTYYTADGLGSQSLMNEVDRVSIVAGKMGTIANVQATEDFANSTLAALGIDGTGMTLEQKQKAMTDKATELAMKNLGITTVDGTNQAQVKAEAERITGNALVLYTAQKTSSMSADEAKNLLNGVTSQDIANSMSSSATDAKKTEGLNQAALAYGMYYAYVNSDQCTDTSLSKNNINATDVTTALDTNQEFKDYMASEQGTKDMEAYLQALSVVNSASGDSGAMEKLLTEGFASEDLIGILEGTMGK